MGNCHIRICIDMCVYGRCIEVMSGYIALGLRVMQGTVSSGYIGFEGDYTRTRGKDMEME